MEQSKEQHARAVELATALIARIGTEEPMISLEVWRRLISAASHEIPKAHERRHRQVQDGY